MPSLPSRGVGWMWSLTGCVDIASAIVTRRETRLAECGKYCEGPRHNLSYERENCDQRGTRATARTGEPEPPLIFSGKTANTQKGARRSRLLRFSAM